ncbi:hypothetical protein ABPG77_006381 [Micractinium sp. CCAP 211/92]
MEVTASGVPRSRRQEIQKLVERLRGCYAGGLTVGRTAAVIVDGTPDWQQPKLAAAAANDIPVVPADWLDDSALHGFLLCPDKYRLLPGQSRRSSAASTKASCSAAPAAPSPLASELFEPAARQALLEPASMPLPAASPSSPEVERLRGEGRPPKASPGAPAFLDPLPGEGATPGAACITGSPTHVVLQSSHVVPDALDAQLPSPAMRAMYDTADLLPLPSPLAPPGECCLPLPALASAEAPAEEATPRQVPAPGAAGSPALQQAQSDSDTMVARFLSRMPQVTVARGSCMPRWLAPRSRASGGGEDSPGSLLGSRDGQGTAERRDSSRLSSGQAAGAAFLPRPAAQRCAGQLGNEAAAVADEAQDFPSRDGGHGWACPPDASPAPACLPATTLIRLGAQSRQPPPASSLAGIAELHGGSLAGSSGTGQALLFYESAEALPARGPSCTFVAGDATHGARLLYDIGESGEPEYALALVQSIYRLGDEAWMEHRYLLNKEDLLQRPRWAAAAKAAQADELLLSACSYHSPMHLICGDFWLSYPGHALLLGKAGGSRNALGQAQKQQSGAAGPSASAPGACTYKCRRGFDTAAGKVVPLRQALEGFQVA